MKNSLMRFTFFCFISLFQVAHADGNKKEIWIAVNKNIYDSIAATSPNVINVKELHLPNLMSSLRNQGEYYLRVNEDDLVNLSIHIHKTFKRCGGYRIAESPKIASRNTTALASFPSTQFGWYEFQKSLIPVYEINQQEKVESWFNEISRSYMNKIVEKLTSYHTRYYKSPEGRESSLWIAEEWRELTKSRSDMSVSLYNHPTHTQPTVILRIEGSDPTLKDQTIILGGHADSINTNDEGIHSHAPGADDNAAGIAVLSEIIRNVVLNNYAPKHSIEFIAYAAEEVGIQGSYELAKHYRSEEKKVLGVIQFDGVNFNQSKDYDMALISDSTDPEQNQFVAGLINEYLKLRWTWQACGYGCSDHAAWNYEGYRASYPLEAPIAEENPFIHTPEDTFEKSGNDTLHASLFVKLGIAYIIELDQ